MSWRWLWRVPILLAMGMVAVPSLLVYGNAAHQWVAGVPMFSDTALHGVQTAAPAPEPSLASLSSGAYEHQFAAFFGQHFPLLAEAVRAKGQLYWSVLRQSPTWYVVAGRHDVLYETDYLDEYCSRDIAAFRLVAETWAAKLMEIQRSYAARNKIFLYLLTPSKAATEPDDMPLGWPCGASAQDRAGWRDAYRAILRDAGVNFVDAVATTEAAKGEYPFPPFPQGGIHFNSVAAARAVQELITVLNRVSGWRRMDDMQFTWRMGPPDEVDRDLLDAMNVPDPGMHYETPELAVAGVRTAGCIPVLMGQVGGSFTYQVDKVLQQLPCPPSIDLYEYFRNTMAFYPGDRRYPVDAVRRRWMLLDAAEVVVLEENEEIAARSDHGQAFYEFVTGHGAPE